MISEPRPRAMDRSVQASRRPLLAAAAGSIILLAATGFAFAQTPATDPVIAKVNGVDIHQSDLALAEEDIGQNMPVKDEAGRRDYLINYLADMVLLSKAAEAKKVQDTPDFKRREAYSHNKALMEVMLQNESKAATTDANLHKVYDEATKQMGAEQEVHARHILFRVVNPTDAAASKAAEAKVKAVIDRVKKGEDFNKLANELTEDPSGKDNGGDLGYFTKEQMVPEFSEVAFKLDKGQVSDPVKTQFGWHVLKVEDKRQRQPPAFDTVRDQVENYAVRKAQVELVGKLRADAKIDRLDQPAGAAAPAAPAETPKK
jgi:peptidyl-prolyl cis-trans isomerase C